MIGIASDHHGFEIKQKMINYLTQLGYNVIDYGCDSSESVDYPIYAFKIGEEVKNKTIEFGVLLCKSGIGMSIACNKVKGSRCAKIDNIDEVILSRQHNNANVISLSSQLSFETIKNLVTKFLTTPFSNEERHEKRIEMIDKYDT